MYSPEQDAPKMTVGNRVNSKSEKDNTPVTVEMERQSDLLNELRMLLNQLERKLEPVMSFPTPEKEIGSSTEEQGLSPLHDFLRNQNNKISHITTELNNIFKKIQL